MASRSDLYAYDCANHRKDAHLMRRMHSFTLSQVAETLPM